MGATTEFHRVAIQLLGLATNLHHADFIAVFVAEELLDIGTAFDAIMGHFDPADRLGGFDVSVDLGFDLIDLIGAECAGVEVEAQAVAADHRALLRGIAGDDFVQCPV